MVIELDVHLPRYAFSTRDVARAGHVWRAFQEAAVLGSTAAGWSPQRYREAGIAFVVRAMTTVHHGEARYGERVTARTWVSSFRRGVFTDRQIRLASPDGPLASTTQQWVHVTHALKPQRAAPELLASFPLHTDEPDVVLPEVESLLEGPEHHFSFVCWHTTMDPLGHANHPAYLDWVEEALAHVAVVAGIDPVDIVPVAEQVRWRLGVTGGDEVHIRWRATGRTGAGAVVIEASLCSEAGRELATATLLRTTISGPEALLRAVTGV